MNKLFTFFSSHFSFLIFPCQFPYNIDNMLKTAASVFEPKKAYFPETKLDAYCQEQHDNILKKNCWSLMFFAGQCCFRTVYTVHTIISFVY